MPENEILAEIRRTREAIARECDFDVAKLFAHYREVSAKLEAEGWWVGNPEEKAAASLVLREEPPTP